MPNVALTGIPRSGTTLSCFLLNKLPDVVALHEPLSVRQLAGEDHAGLCRSVQAAMAETRESLLTRGVAISKHRDGRVPDNPIAGKRSGAETRERIITGRDEIRVEKPLTPDFTLVIKHPAAFTGMLGTLVAQQVPAFAVIRNPLSVLSSWQTVPFNVRDGRARAAERVVPALARALDAIPDVLDRQIHLLSWFFEQYRTHLTEEQMVRYEDVIASGGSVLARITPAAASLAEPLESRNTSSMYDPKRMREIGDRLLAAEGAFWHFYTRESVEALLAA
jgi:hypothetical protein